MLGFKISWGATFFWSKEQLESNKSDDNIFWGQLFSGSQHLFMVTTFFGTNYFGVKCFLESTFFGFNSSPVKCFGMSKIWLQKQFLVKLFRPKKCCHLGQQKFGINLSCIHSESYYVNINQFYIRVCFIPMMH